MKRIRILAAALATALVCSGCQIGDVANQLRAPRPTGEQRAIQAALDSYIARSGGSREYILKYPQDGDYMSAFVMEDIDADDEEEAVAFYQFTGEGEPTHIHLLDKQDGKWQSVSDLEGFSADISGVAFGDLDGDGIRELLAGWSLYNSRDRQLGVYSLAGETITAVSDDQYYTKLVVTDFITPGKDDLLLFQLDTAQNTAVVRLKSLTEIGLTERGQAPIDGYIRSFGDYCIGKLADGLHGVYIDGYKDAGTTITELIYWDGNGLRTPFYNEYDFITSLTARQTAIPCMDIDGPGDRDSRVEWPSCTRLPGYEEETTADAMWLTEWKSWQYETQSAERLFASIVNTADRYYLVVPDAWLDESANAWGGTVTADYASSTHLLRLFAYKEERADHPFLTIRVGAADDGDDEPGEALEIVDADGNRIRYRITYDETYGLDREQVQYLLRPLRG
ncbi:MAG: hypothetical protein ACOYJY_00480 [Acutalibacteraceae bacterium]